MWSSRSCSASRPTSPLASSAPASFASPSASFSRAPPSSAATACSTGRRPCWDSYTACTTRSPVSPDSSPPRRPSSRHVPTAGAGMRSTPAMAAPSSTIQSRSPRNSSSGTQPRTSSGGYPCRRPPKSWNAAVFCAVEGCDHLDCHGDGPFLVAFVGTDRKEGIWVTSGCFYSSEASAWSGTTSVYHPDASIEMQPSVLSGNAVYFLCDPSTRILRCEFVGERELSVIDRPDVHENNIVLITAEDGTLGFAGVQESSLYLWSMELDADGAVAWLQYRVVDLGALLPSRALMVTPDAIGFAEGVNVIFVRTTVGLFTIELKSGQVRKVSSRGSVCTAIPYTSFYTPDRVIRQLPTPMRMQ